MAQKSDEDLTNSLRRLVDAGLLFRQGALPNVTYLFKHALIQDAAYSTLLRESRRALHARIAAALENNFPDAVVNQPEILARHCAEAGMPEKAARLLERRSPEVTCALCADRGDRAVRMCAPPNRGGTKHSILAQGAHQVSGRPDHPVDARSKDMLLRKREPPSSVLRR